MSNENCTPQEPLTDLQKILPAQETVNDGQNPLDHPTQVLDEPLPPAPDVRSLRFARLFSILASILTALQCAAIVPCIACTIHVGGKNFVLFSMFFILIITYSGTLSDLIGPLAPPTIDLLAWLGEPSNTSIIGGMTVLFLILIFLVLLVGIALPYLCARLSNRFAQESESRKWADGYKKKNAYTQKIALIPTVILLVSFVVFTVRSLSFLVTM